MDLEEDLEPDFPLPEGVSKEILTEAATSEWRQPTVGDEVTIRCTAAVTWGGKVDGMGRFAAKQAC